jgi:hypothetical protein
VDDLAAGVTFHGDLGYGPGFGLTAPAIHLMTWQTIPAMPAGPAAGLIGGRRGLRPPLVAAVVCATAAVFLHGPFHGSWTVLLPVGVLFGLAFGLFYGCDNNLMIEAVPEEQQGVAAGTLTLAGSFGGALGTAVLAAILSAHPYRATVTTTDGGETFDIPQVCTDTGLMSTERDGDLGVSPRMSLARHLAGPAGGRAARLDVSDAPLASVFHVLAEGTKDGAPAMVAVESHYDMENPVDDDADITAIPAAAFLRRLIGGEIDRPGVLAPEACVAPEPFLREVFPQLGVDVRRTVTRTERFA